MEPRYAADWLRATESQTLIQSLLLTGGGAHTDGLATTQTKGKEEKNKQSSSMANVFGAHAILSSQTPCRCHNFKIHFQETRKHLNVKHIKWIMGRWLSLAVDKAVVY